jgi:hypothetical protein
MLFVAKYLVLSAQFCGRGDGWTGLTGGPGITLSYSLTTLAAYVKELTNYSLI